MAKNLELFKSAIENSGQAIILTECKINCLEPEIAYVNPAFEKMFGYRESEVIGKKLDIISGPKTEKINLGDICSKLLEGEKISRQNTVYGKAGNEFEVDCSIAVLRNSKGKATHFVCVHRDITELKRMERMKDEFLSTVSHELRTPLSITKEGICLVLDKIPGELNKEQEKLLTIARDNADRLARIINNLLDVSKLQTGRITLEKEKTNIVNIIKQAVSFLGPKAKEKGLELKVNYDLPELFVFADSERLNLVFIKLIENAVRFTDGGFVEISVKEKIDEVECIVEDTGVGLSKDDYAKIFGEFQQVGRMPGPGDRGIGLGLSIAKGIIEMHNGKIWVQSEPHKGTKFIFTLPKYENTGE